MRWYISKSSSSLKASRFHHALYYVFRIFQSFCHIGVLWFHRFSQGESFSRSLFVYESNQSTIAADYYFCVVLEAHLNDLVIEAEQDCMLSSHPLFHVDGVLNLFFLFFFSFFSSLWWEFIKKLIINFSFSYITR